MSFAWQSLIERATGTRPLVMAHRGASDELPENTRAAFERALAQGADILETDLRFTRDNVLILMHDPTVDRTTDGEGAVAELTLAEIKRMRAQPSPPTPLPVGEGSNSEGASPSPSGRGAGDMWSRNTREAGVSRLRRDDTSGGESAIPTLDELLELTQAHQTPLALELKDDRFLDARGAELLVEQLARRNALERVVLVSFKSELLQSCKRVAPKIPIGMITLKNPLPTYSTELLGPFYPLLYLNPLYIYWAKRLRKIVCPLDPSPEPRLRYYLRLGAPVIMTNHPAQTIAALNTIGNRETGR